MARHVLAFVLLALLPSPATAQPAQGPPAQQNPTVQSERVRQGVSHFERAFYDLSLEPPPSIAPPPPPEPAPSTLPANRQERPQRRGGASR